MVVVVVVVIVVGVWWAPAMAVVSFSSSCNWFWAE